MMSLKLLFSRRRLYDDLSEAIREHLEEKIEELVAGGMSRKEASNVARREFGNVELVKESAHDVWGWRWLEDLVEDFRFGLRMLRKNPGFTTVSVLTLALGIGANTGIFSVVSAVLLHPLPFPNPEKIVQLGAGLDNGEPNGSVTVPQFIFCRDHCEAVFDSVAGFQVGPTLELKQHGRVDWVTSLWVTDDFFRVAGVNPALGRGFRREETQPGALPSVVLSDALWRRAFDANPDVIGAQLYLDDGAYTRA
jgi:putative ABC transport system permease protein